MNGKSQYVKDMRKRRSNTLLYSSVFHLSGRSLLFDTFLIYSGSPLAGLFMKVAYFPIFTSISHLLFLNHLIFIILAEQKSVCLLSKQRIFSLLVLLG